MDELELPELPEEVLVDELELPGPPEDVLVVDELLLDAVVELEAEEPGVLDELSDADELGEEEPWLDDTLLEEEPLPGGVIVPDEDPPVHPTTSRSRTQSPASPR